jgi:hypothetical protein
MAAAARFSSRRSIRRVPGIGTIQGFWASSQASATWAELLQGRQDLRLGLPPVRMVTLAGT